VDENELNIFYLFCRKLFSDCCVIGLIFYNKNIDFYMGITVTSKILIRC
jgi:hypothetical protein